jgi:hypothetical protein
MPDASVSLHHALARLESAPYDRLVRTTLSIEPDLAAELKERARRSGAPWKQVVNEALRAGLRASPKLASGAPYQTPVDDAGPPALRGVHSVHDLLAFAEGEDFR